MNKKGFTTIELIVSFTLVTIILFSLISFSINYRNKSHLMEIENSLNEFKNNFTKIVYDDIISGKVTKITSCDSSNCANLLGDESYQIKVVEKDKDVYLSYRDILYQIPNSTKNNTIINDFEISNYDDLYHLKITIHHTVINKDLAILININ